MGVFNVHGKQLIRLLFGAVHGSHHDARTANRQFVAFAAHVFQQDGEMQFAAARYDKRVRIGGKFDLEGDIRLQLAFQALTNLPAGDILTVAAGQWRGIDQKVHGQCWLVHLQQRERFRIRWIGQRNADPYFFDAVDQYDIARLGFFDHGALEALEHQYLIDLGHFRFAVRTMHDGDLLSRTDTSLRDPAN